MKNEKKKNFKFKKKNGKKEQQGRARRGIKYYSPNFLSSFSLERERFLFLSDTILGSRGRKGTGERIEKRNSIADSVNERKYSICK